MRNSKNFRTTDRDERNDKNAKSGKSRNRQGKRKSSYKPSAKLEEQIKSGDFNNDPKFYFGNPELMEQVSSFSFNQFLETDGKPFNYGYYQDLIVPGIMTLFFNPCPGYTAGTGTADGGVNIASMKTYTYLSANNAKTTQYAPQDVATLILALGEVISRYEWIRRAFRVVFLYNKRNWNFPKELIHRMGIDVDDFFAHIADYRLQFNALVNSINQISFPGDIPYFEKCAAMYSHVYMDSESPMGQVYLFNPATSWVVDETSYDQGTILKTVPFTMDLTGAVATRTMQEYLNQLSDLIQSILNSATFNVIYSDVLRIVDPGKLLTMPYLIEGDGLAPEYDPMIILQIHNSVIMGMPNGAALGSNTPKNDVYPKVDNNAVFYAPTFNLTQNIVPTKEFVLDFPHSMGNPDVTQRVEATRMTSLLKVDDEGHTVKGSALADHYVVAAFMAYSGALGALLQSSMSTTTAYSDYGFKVLAALSKFEGAPRVTVYSANSEVAVGQFGDLDYFTSIDYTYLNKVNDLAFAHLLTPGIVSDKIG